MQTMQQIFVVSLWQNRRNSILEMHVLKENVCFTLKMYYFRNKYVNVWLKEGLQSIILQQQTNRCCPLLRPNKKSCIALRRGELSWSMSRESILTSPCTPLSFLLEWPLSKFLSLQVSLWSAFNQRKTRYKKNSVANRYTI